MLAALQASWQRRGVVWQVAHSTCCRGEVDADQAAAFAAVVATTVLVWCLVVPMVRWRHVLPGGAKSHCGPSVCLFCVCMCVVHIHDDARCTALYRSCPAGWVNKQLAGVQMPRPHVVTTSVEMAWRHLVVLLALVRPPCACAALVVVGT